MLYEQLADIRVACSYTEYKYLQPFPPAPFCFLPPQPEQFARPSVRPPPSSSNALPPSPFSACIGTTSRSTGFIALSALLTPLCDAIDTEQGATEAAESLGLLIVFTTRPDHDHTRCTQYQSDDARLTNPQRFALGFPSLRAAHPLKAYVPVSSIRNTIRISSLLLLPPFLTIIPTPLLRSSFPCSLRFRFTIRSAFFSPNNNRHC